MLSLGYTLLLNDIVSAVYRIGLDPAIGFFHTVDYGRPSLALDLEEEFRPVIVDTLVLGILRQGLLAPTDFSSGKKGRQGFLAPTDFSRGKKGRQGMRMTDDARRFFIARYEERLGVHVRHPAADQNLTYRQCIQRQAEHVARCILGQDGAYSPLLIR